ncbi:hypothetical protein TB2_044123 [Malus domestica]|nr:probable protein phosphatase 2C 51 [Malus domestica]
MECSGVLHLIVLGLLFAGLPTLSYGRESSSTCLTLYEHGGAPAVFESPECRQLKHSDDSQRTSLCQMAMLQGRRKYLEDRTLCALDVRILFPGRVGIMEEVRVGVAAVFDGHNGAEASDMASKLFLEYFVLHTYFLLDASLSAESSETPTLQNWHGLLDRGQLDIARFKHSLQANLDHSFRFDILKEALLRAVHDIDAKFSKAAFMENLNSGSTATIILLLDGQILVANIGDSKAFLCSEKFQTPAEAKAAYLRLYMEERRNGVVSHRWRNKNFELAPTDELTHLSVKELTRDHHPDRDDEKRRVESAGGNVFEWAGVPRVNGQLAVTRSIGDISFKSFGVVSEPELTDWQPLTVNDTYLVATSDGVFEKQSLQDVCDLLWEARSHHPTKLELSSAGSYSLADRIVSTAFERGSIDNMAAVVVPLASSGLSQPEPLLRVFSFAANNSSLVRIG